MHGINVENKGFKSVTDYVRVRYIPSASSKAYVGQKAKGAYWNGVLGAHAGGNIGAKPEGSSLMGWIQCFGDSCSWSDVDGSTPLAKRTTAGALMPGKKWTVSMVESTAEESTYAHTILF